MFNSLLQWDILQKIIMNTVLVSVPEELYLLMFTLILVGEFEFWTQEECKKLIHRYDYVRIIVPTLVGATLSNVERYLGLNYGFTSLIPPLVFFILIVLTNDVFGDASTFKWIGKAFIYLILGLLTVYISEFAYSSLFLYGTGRTVADLNNNLLLNFIVSLPSRVVEYSILFFFIMRKRTLLKANIIKPITNNKITTFLAIFAIIFNFAFMFLMVKTVTYEKILYNIPSDLKVVVVLGISLFPIVNLSALIWSCYIIKNHEVEKQRQASVKLNILFNELKEIYTNKEKYDNIKWKLNEIGMGMEELSKNLYTTNRKIGDRRN